MIPKECKRFAEVDFPIAEVLNTDFHRKLNRHNFPPIFEY
jgi:hypothetical protein